MFDWVGRAGLVAILCGLSMTASVAETLSRYSLDAMLAGFTDGCSRSPELEAYWGSVISDEAPVLPEGAERFFSEPKTRHDDEWREIRVRVEADWMGHKVDHLAFYAGNENGISILTVRFDPADEGVHATFEPLAGASSARLAADPENYINVTTAFVSEGGVSQYYCDYST